MALIEINLDIFDTDDLVYELHERGFNFMDEVDEEDLAEYIEATAYGRVTQNTLDNVDQKYLEEIIQKFHQSSLLERQEMYNKLK